MGIKKTILVTGANGQLGSELQALQQKFTQYIFLFTDKNELAVNDAAAVDRYFKTQAIDFCINCAAYTAVDKAEADTEAAFLINATAAATLAAACHTHNAGFIHISTDYVFNGNGTKPYKETDTASPVNVYGQSKLKGEQLVLQNNPLAIIIRTSWVYSAFGNNFVKTMRRLMNERESINVVNDQFGCPTYAADLALVIMQIIAQWQNRAAVPAVFNYCNNGIINWWQFALAVKELTGSHCTINPIASTQYPTAAKRPHYSVLDTALIKQTFGIVIPDWKESLQACLKMIG
jgi:dTDP-4-dehydrorhamnose reductase